MISRNDKSKQLTIIRLTKTRSKREKYTFCNIKSLEHLKNLKNGPVFYLHTCHQKPNPSREAVPLISSSSVLTYDPEDGGYGALYDGEAEAVEAALHSLVRPALAVQVVVRDVSREINRKPE